MRKYLVVGCGGSGGGTLRFLMDQLTADLAESGWSHLPAAWQFVHIDVPLNPDRGPGQLGSVPEQGGRYESLAYPGVVYTDVAEKVDRAFTHARAARLLSSWRPDPAGVNFPVTNGAGQYRAVGRVLTLAQARTDALKVLKASWSALNDSHVNGEMAAVVDQVPGLGAAEFNQAPIVLIISSMAGGAGASMVLDIARLLSQVEGVDPGSVALFLLTPDVFETLTETSRPGVDANAAATLAELVAAQAQRDGLESEAETYRALGISARAGDRAFGRVFPVGRRIGNEGALLGDGTPPTVFRALGRGLAALMMAGDATERFASFDLTNLQVSARREQFGWGVSPSDIAWGCFGFASVSLGRGRYAAYAAQRLARYGLDRLASGHEVAGGQGTAVEQVRTLVDQQLSPSLQRAGLPSTATDPRAWFTTVAFPARDIEGKARTIVDTEVAPHVRVPVAGSDTDDWLRVTDNEMTQRRAVVRSRVDDDAKHWAIGWYQRLTTAIEEETASAIASLGLPYTVAWLGRVRTHLDVVAAELAAAGASPPDPAKWSPPTAEKLKGMRATKVSNPDVLAGTVIDGYRESVVAALRARSAALAAETMESANNDLLVPLEDACREALREVERSRVAPVTGVGLAQLDTTEYGAWPSEGETPDRFDEAVNEVLITPSSDFPGLFAAHLTAESGSAPLRETINQVVERVLRGEWPSVAGQRPPGGLVHRTGTWRPGAIQLDPDTKAPVLASRASYRVTARPGDVLDRASQYVARPGQVFDTYTSESLHDYVASDTLSESERAERVNDVVRKFRQALHLARPLVGVSTSAVEHLHGSHERVYKFGPVPLPIEVVRRFESILDDPAERIDATAKAALRSAVRDDSRSTRIDIFGSYAPYLPVVFTSLLQPISERWAATPDYARPDFWQWRRARPLPAALPMGREQRRAMVAGWLVGQITGRLSVPSNVAEPGADAIRVWDTSSSSWLAFPSPLLVPKGRWQAPADVLAAVLESMVIAVADGHDSRSQSSLRPYTALRNLYDQHPERPSTGMEELVAARNLARWVADGATKSGSSVVGRKPATPEDRKQAALAWLDDTARAVAAANDASPHVLDPARPLVLDLADDVVWAATKLVELIKQPPELGGEEPQDNEFTSGLDF